MVRKIEKTQWYIKYPKLCGRKCLVDVRGQRRIGRMVRDDRKATLTQITTRYIQGMQNTISERTTRRTLKQMGYSSRRPDRVPLLSAKNRKRRLQFAQGHQNWTVEDWKKRWMVWCVSSSAVTDGRVRIWCKEHKSMDPSCLNDSGWWWWCNNGVGDIFLAHFGPLSTNWASFKCNRLPEYCCWPCPSLYDYSVSIFWWLLPAG